MKKDLLTLNDLTTEQIVQILDLTREVKSGIKQLRDHLQDCTIALLFQKPSNRTRVSFEVGIRQLGGHCIYLGPDEINLGIRESNSDVAKTLSRYVDGIVARTHSHEDLVELTKDATIPVINGLSDQFHPCQALTDIFTIRENFSELKGLKLAYIGDGNNVCHSLILGCAKLGINVHIATPEGYEPEESIFQDAVKYAEKHGTTLSLSQNPEDAVKDAHVVYSDVWISMGQENEVNKRLYDFNDFQINESLMQLAHNDHIFMHCLPAHRGQEVTSEVIDGEHSIVFDQAENRLHTQKAILITLINKKILD